MVLDTGRDDQVWAVAFHPDGKHVFGGDEAGIQQWRLADGREVGQQTGMKLRAIAVSSDRKWIVCGARDGASVWDGEMHEKGVEVEGGNMVFAVDVSQDSSRFATGTTEKEAGIWSITSGERLAGPLTHDDYVTGVRFSRNGERLATACMQNSVHIFDSHTGDSLVTIEINIPSLVGTPLAWSSDAQQIFAACKDNKIRSFDTSTGSQIAESQTLPGDDNIDVHSVALAANNKFIATFANHSISFLDSSTLTRIGPVIEDGEQIRSIDISPDSSRLATGRLDGKIVIRDLNMIILMDSYSPFHVSNCAFVNLRVVLSNKTT